MAAPTISAIDGVPTAPVGPGTPIDLVVVCSDADTRDINIELVATDASGARSAPVSVTVQVVDALDSEATIVTGGGTLTKVGPLSWHFVP